MRRLHGPQAPCGARGGRLEPLAGTRFRVISDDQRGAGRSIAGPEAAYGWEQQTTHLDAVRNSLRASKVQLLGHSWGGAIALS